MVELTTVSTSRMDAEASCEVCQAGALIAFNWAFAHERANSEDLEQIASLTSWKELRRGELFRCNVCHEVWHLEGDRKIMTHLAKERLPIVLEWNECMISLTERLRTRLQHIGPTSPDTYGNWSDRRVTPCRVTTTMGEVLDPAIVCVQLEAPVQFGMNFRLGSEIADVAESDFALPLDVRLASSRAEEMRMGFSPTLIEMQDGKKFVLNGMTSFLTEEGYEARRARVAIGDYFSENPPPAFARDPAVVYFVVEGQPGWLSQTSHQPKASWLSWLRRLFDR